MSLGDLRRWFELTREEQLWIAAVLAIFLIGLVARCHHLSRSVPEAVPVPQADE